MVKTTLEHSVQRSSMIFSIRVGMMSMSREIPPRKRECSSIEMTNTTEDEDTSTDRVGATRSELWCRNKNGTLTMETKNSSFVDSGLKHLIVAAGKIRSAVSFYLKAKSMEPWPVIEAEKNVYTKHGADIDTVMELVARLDRELSKLHK